MFRRRSRSFACFACIAGCTLAAGGLSAAQAGQHDAKALSGKTKIRKIELLKLTGGSHRGSLLLWADVVHGRVSTGAKARPAASQLGLLRVELRRSGVSASGTDRFRLPVSAAAQVARPENGYRVRIPRRRAEALGSGPIDVVARASQSLDLNGDGQPDATSTDSEHRHLSPTPVQQLAFPRPGAWAYSDSTTSYTFNTNSRSVVLFSAFSKTNQCSFQDPMHSPVDPETGFWKHYDGEVDVSSQFNAGDTSAIVTGDVNVGGCYQDFLHEASFTLAQ
jgi:hypothetical protein